MALQFVIEEDATTVSWRHAGPRQAIDLTVEEAKIAAMVDQAHELGQVAAALYAIAEAITEASFRLERKS